MRISPIQNKVRLGVLLMMLAAASGCETSPSATEADYGNSVRDMVRNQTANPGPADAKPVDTGDGVRAQNTLEVYRTDVAQPENVKKDLIINAGGDR